MVALLVWMSQLTYSDNWKPRASSKGNTVIVLIGLPCYVTAQNTFSWDRTAVEARTYNIKKTSAFIYWGLALGILEFRLCSSIRHIVCWRSWQLTPLADSDDKRNYETCDCERAYKRGRLMQGRARTREYLQGAKGPRLVELQLQGLSLGLVWLV